MIEYGYMVKTKDGTNKLLVFFFSWDWYQTEKIDSWFLTHPMYVVDGEPLITAVGF